MSKNFINLPNSKFHQKIKFYPKKNLNITNFVGSRCRVRIHDAHVRPRYGVTTTTPRSSSWTFRGSSKARRRAEGAGRQVIATAKSADLIFIVLDATKDDTQKEEAGGGAGVGGDSLEQEPAEHLPHRQKGRRHPLQQHGEVQPGGREDGLQYFKRVQNPQRRRGV